MYGHIHGSRSADAKFVSHIISPCSFPTTEDLVHFPISFHDELVGRYHQLGELFGASSALCILCVKGK